MADEKKDQLRLIEDLAKQGADAKKAIEEFAKQGEETRKTIEEFTKQGEEARKWIGDWAKQNAQAMMSVIGVGKQITAIAESMKWLDEVLRLTKEGKLGAYSDDTPVPERLGRLKETQKKALETGQVDVASATAWIEAHWPAPRKCPLCNHEDWGIGPSFAQIATSTLGLHKPPRINPCVAVVCGHCGNTIFLNAILMGLLQASGG
jgi:hypothetical protein